MITPSHRRHGRLPRTMVRLSAAVAGGVLVVGCAGSAEEAAEPTLEEAIDAEAGGEQREAELRTEVQYGQAGGIAGTIEELRIAPDGTGELTSRGLEPVPVELDEDQVGALAAALEDANLAEQPEDQMSDPAIPDAFTFELSYDGGHVLTDEFAAPDEVMRVLEMLRAIVEDARAGAS